ncbi:MAG TPA: glycosyltransferase family 39 protein, partial [Candidatus Binatia bacterium]|nr:glycosyltransferase family 39 protein [Candidatus Binatia bacterium]
MNKSPSLSPPHISPQARRRAWLIVAMLGICLLAFGLRLYDLDGQSMWSDEGLSLYRARQPLAGIMANVITVDGVDTNDTNPPFYFLLLAGWRALFGERIFLLRYVGVLAGLLSVPLIYALGHTLFSTQVGAMAALFLALSPFHVWQTQVLRNYGLLITINLFSIYGLARFLFANGGAAGKWKWAALWLGAGLLGIYTHYFGFFIFAFTLLSLLAALVARHRARHVLPARRLVLGLLLILLLSSPALFSALARFNAGRQIDFYDVHTLDVVVQAASAFGVGMSPTLTHPWSWVLPGLLLFAAGIRMGWRCSRSATVLLLAYQVLPLGLLLAFSIVNPLFNGTRHLLIGLPPFLLIAAIGPGMLLQPGLHVARYVRPLALSLAALFLTLQVIWLQEQFHSPDLVRDDIRGAAEYLSRMAGPDDVVVLHDTLIKFTFDYYYDGQAPVIAIPLYGEQDEPEAISRLREAGREGEIVWFLTQPQPRTGFPRSVLWDWAEAHWKRLASETFAWMWLPLRLRAYTAAPEQAELPEEAAELHARFGDRIELQGASVPDSLQSGEPFDMTLYLSQDGRSAEDYEISLRFTDAAGQLWQQIEDGLWPAYPPAGWPAHGLVRYDHIARLPAGLPPGVYQVWMRIVDGQSKQPLLLASGEADLRLPDVAVSAAACEQKEQMGAELKRASALFGTDLTLEGYSQALETYRPG